MSLVEELRLLIAKHGYTTRNRARITTGASQGVFRVALPAAHTTVRTVLKILLMMDSNMVGLCLSTGVEKAFRTYERGGFDRSVHSLACEDLGVSTTNGDRAGHFVRSLCSLMPARTLFFPFSAKILGPDLSSCALDRSFPYPLPLTTRHFGSFGHETTFASSRQSGGRLTADLVALSTDVKPCLHD